MLSKGIRENIFNYGRRFLSIVTILLFISAFCMPNQVHAEEAEGEDFFPFLYGKIAVNGTESSDGDLISLKYDQVAGGASIVDRVRYEGFVPEGKYNITGEVYKVNTKSIKWKLADKIATSSMEVTASKTGGGEFSLDYGTVTGLEPESLYVAILRGTTNEEKSETKTFEFDSLTGESRNFWVGEDESKPFVRTNASILNIYNKGSKASVSTETSSAEAYIHYETKIDKEIEKKIEEQEKKLEATAKKKAAAQAKALAEALVANGQYVHYIGEDNCYDATPFYEEEDEEDSEDTDDQTADDESDDSEDDELDEIDLADNFDYDFYNSIYDNYPDLETFWFESDGSYHYDYFVNYDSIDYDEMYYTVTHDTFSISDSVRYNMLSPGKKYRVTATLHLLEGAPHYSESDREANESSGKFKDVNVKDVTSEFTADGSGNGSFELDFGENKLDYGRYVITLKVSSEDGSEEYVHDDLYDTRETMRVTHEALVLTAKAAPKDDSSRRSGMNGSGKIKFPGNEKSPDTGDSGFIIWFYLGIAALSATVLCSFTRKRILRTIAPCVVIVLLIVSIAIPSAAYAQNNYYNHIMSGEVSADGKLADNSSLSIPFEDASKGIHVTDNVRCSEFLPSCKYTIKGELVKVKTGEYKWSFAETIGTASAEITTNKKGEHSLILDFGTITGLEAEGRYVVRLSATTSDSRAGSKSIVHSGDTHSLKHTIQIEEDYSQPFVRTNAYIKNIAGSSHDYNNATFDYAARAFEFESRYVDKEISKRVAREEDAIELATKKTAARKAKAYAQQLIRDDKWTDYVRTKDVHVMDEFEIADKKGYDHYTKNTEEMFYRDIPEKYSPLEKFWFKKDGTYCYDYEVDISEVDNRGEYRTDFKRVFLVKDIIHYNKLTPGEKYYIDSELHLLDGAPYNNYNYGTNVETEDEKNIPESAIKDTVLKKVKQEFIADETGSGSLDLEYGEMELKDGRYYYSVSVKSSTGTETYEQKGLYNTRNSFYVNQNPVSVTCWPPWRITHYYLSGTGKTNFPQKSEVKPPNEKSPDTGDSEALPAYILLAAVSLGILIMRRNKTARE